MTRKMLRDVGVVLLGCGIVAGGLELGGSRTPQAIAAAPLVPYYSEDTLPPYPNAMEFPLGEALAVNGLPIKLSHFTTPDAPMQVRDYYYAYFRAKGSLASVYPTEKGGFTVTAVVGGGRDQAVVAITPRKGGSPVFPSLVPMDTAPGAALTPASELPFTEYAVGLSKTTEKGAGAGEVVTWHEPLMDKATAMAFVSNGMTERGWSAGERMEAFHKNSAQLTFHKAGRTAVITLKPFETQPVGVSVAAHYRASED